MRYTFKRAFDVTLAEEKSIKKLRLELGNIWDHYNEYREAKKTYVILVREKKEMVAWGLLFWHPIHKEWDFAVYVKRKWRRKGIGSRVYKKMKKNMKLKNSQIEVHRHDDPSTFFFDKLQSKKE